LILSYHQRVSGLENITGKLKKTCKKQNILIRVKSRLDPILRGIERRKTFLDDEDRDAFVNRLGKVLIETQTDCFAWALIPNHVHLLVRTGLTPITTVMRRFLKGYAVQFNRRHRRHGHLFQNRFP